ncbi:hypothetical protein [Hymenobacter chitinivorans]|uniref:Heavy-metal resistance protein n=1 Tax=Hymenobacter chitinivorans DSM 11115 TaxID=1121954 RepID=A0A2M9BQU2_9BACT|nr:hypothetical protein [Hymenobacter chitinivorans]PJJ60309.1 hypothetical protein CLV45_1734 [Hymenobacter chitinivorans DSM 11115]
MKKAQFFALLALSAQTAAFAGNDPDGPSAIQARATTLTRTMAQQTKLDEGQYLKVKQLNLRMLTELDDLKTRFAADPAILDQQLAGAQTRYEAELASLLRPTQYAVYQQARSGMTALGATK